VIIIALFTWNTVLKSESSLSLGHNSKDGKVLILMKRLFLFLAFLLTSLFRVSALDIEIPNVANFTIPQLTSETCWAACNRMLLKSQGIDVSEAEELALLMQRTGHDGRQGVGPTFALSSQALAGVYPRAGGGSLSIMPFEFYVANPTHDPRPEILASLQAGRPLVITDGVHGYVVYGGSYNIIGSVPVFSTLKVINPMFGLDPATRRYEVYPPDRGRFGPWLGHMGFTVRITNEHSNATASPSTSVLTFRSAIVRALSAVQNNDPSIRGTLRRTHGTHSFYVAAFGVSGMDSTEVTVRNNGSEQTVEMSTGDISHSQALNVYGHLKSDISSVLGTQITSTDDQGDDCTFFFSSGLIRLYIVPGDPGEVNGDFVTVSVEP